MLKERLNKHGFGRRNAVVILAAVTLGAVPLAWASAGPGAQSAGAGLKLDQIRTSQQAILKTGKLKVRVSAKKPGHALVTARSRVAGSQELIKIGKQRRVKFGAGDLVRRVKLKLNGTGRGLVGGCKKKNLIFEAVFEPAKRPGTRVSSRASAPLNRDRPICNGGGPGPGPDPGPEQDPVARPYDGAPIDTANSDRCDFFDAAVCLQPWPNDYFTAEDASTDSGRLLNLNALSMPRNKAGKPIDPIPYNHNDGFSPGQLVVTRVPGLDTPAAFQNTAPASIDHPGRYDDPDTPIVAINTETGERQPIFAEIDANPTDPLNTNPTGPQDVNLMIRPLRNWDENTRYIIAMRDLKNANGQTIPATDAFRVYRDRLITGQAPVEARRDHMESLFTTLRAAGIRRSNLFLAWDFTIASERNLSERALSIRDDAFAKLGDTNLSDLTVQGSSPPFTIDTVSNFSAAQNPRIARRVEGKLTVPCYLNAPGCPPGSSFVLPPGSSTPVAIPGNQMSVPFICNIPRSAIDNGANPARPTLYGHGLLGGAGEVNSGPQAAMGSEHNFIYCAVDWAGFATTDVATVLTALQDLSYFPLLIDRMQQGFVNFEYLGRALIHPNGVGSNPAFQVNGQSVINTQRLYYDGNSQGGIMGGALTALSVDSQRSVLGVPGINYSTLLQRSVDFEPYAEGKFGDTAEEVICGQFDSLNPDSLPSQFPSDFKAALLAVRTQIIEACVAGIPEDTPLGLYDNYQNQLERPLIFSLIQIPWDRGEGNGYAQHMTTDPLPNTPAHTVLLHAAFGDHQVANLAAEVEARTIGAGVYAPNLDPGRHWADDPYFLLPQITQFPYTGSALVYYDGGPVGFPGGSGTPPNQDLPPRPPVYGSDPHSYPRNDIKGRAQKESFYSGMMQNFCTTTSVMTGVPTTAGTPIPCYSHGYTGPP